MEVFHTEIDFHNTAAYHQCFKFVKMMNETNDE